MEEFYVLIMPWAVYVKSGEFFEKQGGLTASWGEAWEKVLAHDLKGAREKAEGLQHERFGTA